MFEVGVYKMLRSISRHEWYSQRGRCDNGSGTHTASVRISRSQAEIHGVFSGRTVDTEIYPKLHFSGDLEGATGNRCLGLDILALPHLSAGGTSVLREPQTSLGSLNPSTLSESAKHFANSGAEDFFDHR